MDDPCRKPGGASLASPPEDVPDPTAEALRAGRLARDLQAQGRAAEALPHCEAAVRLAPHLASSLEGLGTALRSLGRIAEARAAYLDAIRLDPGLASAHANLGLISLQEDRGDEAWPHLARAAELDPGRPAYWEYLARSYEWARRFDAAIPCWERALERATADRPRLHLALGVALHEEHRLAEAEGHYREAARSGPDSAEVRVRQGLLLVERGEFAEAEAAFRGAIRLRPDDPAAHACLASLLGERLPDADLDALSGRIADRATGEGPRARLLFALGQVLDARGDHAGAAGRLREANASRLALAPRSRRFDPAEHERSVEVLLRAFGPDFLAAAAGAGHEARMPVFIVGLPRSGTTLLEQILASHPRVRGAGELALGPRLVESLSGFLSPSASPAECAALLGPSTIRQLSEVYLAELRTLAEGRADFVVDKFLDNFLILGLLAALFPNATFIHCRRDLRDAALSCWMADFDSVPWANDPGHIAAYFRAHLRAMDHWRAALPARIHEVRYEDVVADLEGVARRLLSALGLDWDPACLEFHRAGRPVRTGSRTQVRRPLYNGSVARWKHYEHDLADLFAALPPETGHR